jgi:hypothetical protein
LLRELSLFLRVALDILLEFSDLLFNLCEYLGPLLILILGEEELFAEELERQVLIAHVELIYLLLDCDLPLELDIHLDLHRLQLIAIILLRLRREGFGSLGVLLSEALRKLATQADDFFTELINDLGIVRYVEFDVKHVALHHCLYLLCSIRILQSV